MIYPSVLYVDIDIGSLKTIIVCLDYVFSHNLFCHLLWQMKYKW